jgi:hypothetical protein
MLIPKYRDEQEIRDFLLFQSGNTEDVSGIF